MLTQWFIHQYILTFRAVNKWMTIKADKTHEGCANVLNKTRWSSAAFGLSANVKCDWLKWQIESSSYRNMYEVSSVGGSKFDAAAAIQQATPRHQNSVKDHMRRFLRGPKALMRSTSDAHHHNIKNHHHNNVAAAKGNPRNGMVVAIVDGLPFVVGAKNKKAHVGIFMWILK